jgi:hypothetical protein
VKNWDYCLRWRKYDKPLIPSTALKLYTRQVVRLEICTKFALNLHLKNVLYAHQNKENAPFKTQIDTWRVDTHDYLLQKNGTKIANMKKLTKQYISNFLTTTTIFKGKRACFYNTLLLSA